MIASQDQYTVQIMNGRVTHKNFSELKSSLPVRLICVFWMIILSGCLWNGKLYAQGQDRETVRLIVRGDDLGMTHSVNKASIHTYREGIVRSVEVIVPAPWFMDAVELVNNHPELDVGVHLALTSEWEKLKWRPLTNSPGLTDSNGYFFPVIWPNEHYGEKQALKGQDWKLEEIEQELRQQIEVAIANIPRLSHVSYHMGCNDMSPEVKELVDRLAREYGLYVDLEKAGVKGVRFEGPRETADQKIKSFIRMLETLKPGTYLFIEHPAFNDAEMQGVYMKGYENVAADRQGVTKLFTSEKIREAIRKLNIQLISYSDLKKQINSMNTN